MPRVDEVRMTYVEDKSKKPRRTVLLAVLSVPAGALTGWLAMLAALMVPTDRPSVWLGVPAVFVADWAGSPRGAPDGWA